MNKGTVHYTEDKLDLQKCNSNGQPAIQAADQREEVLEQNKYTFGVIL